ncbi:MAG: flagellar hook protein FlgE [Caulobacter sp.]|nr:flagellar hook protein FlgE [Caulobacter sp.]
MSINSAMLAGVSGLVANSSALAAISDNIANVNTVGYKRSQANFSTLVTSQSRASTYSAGGVRAVTHQFVTQQGLTQSTGSNLDLSIAGQGFFVATEKATGVAPTDTRSFTRAGSFTLDDQGYLRNDAGLYLQGWLADPVTGTIKTDPSDLNQLHGIQVGNVAGAVDMTTRVAVNANIDAAQAISPAALAASAAATAWAAPGDVAYDPVNNSMADYANNVAIAAPTNAAPKPDFEIQVPVSDSLGGQRTITLALLKKPAAPGAPTPSGPNEWYAELIAAPGDLASPTNGQIAAGSAFFFPNGQLDVTSTYGSLFGYSVLPSPGPPAVAGVANQPVIQIDASGTTPVVKPTWATALGVSAQNITMDLSATVGGLTQYSSQSIVQAVATNGTAFGNLTSVEVDKDGYVTAIFDNSVTRRVAQVAIATFPNPNGLKPVNGNAYRVTNDSGTFSLRAPSTGGSGAISASTLEASTVDLSTEFTAMIITQRAYSASSKIITTADSMLQDLLAIVR